MAYTKNPQFDTYSTVEFPLVKEFGFVRPEIGPLLFNGVYEHIRHELTGENKISITKRPGSSSVITVGGTEIRGIYYWEDQQKLFVAVDDDIKVYDADDLSLLTTLNTVWATSTGRVGFTEFLYDTGVTKIVAVDGSRLVTIDSSNTVATCADGDLPAHIPDPIYIDGYLLLLKTSTADIYNSDLNDPLLWTAGNFITGEMVPDQATRLVKMNNYAVLLGRKSIEFFYNAAIEQGSPFQRNESYVKQIGFIGGLATLGDTIFFVGSAGDTQANVFVVSDSKVTPIGNNILKLLQNLTSSSDLTGNILSIGGNTLYLVNITSTITLVFDIETGIWSRWGWQATSGFPIDYATGVEISSATSEYRCLFIRPGDTDVYELSDSVYQDDGTNFAFNLLTDEEDFGTMNQKIMHRLVIDCDVSSINLSVSWSDDFYATYSTAQTVDLSDELPCIYRLGRFRKRSLLLAYTGSSTFRLRRVFVDINKGSW